MKVPNFAGAEKQMKPSQRSMRRVKAFHTKEDPPEYLSRVRQAIEDPEPYGIKKASTNPGAILFGVISHRGILQARTFAIHMLSMNICRVQASISTVRVGSAQSYSWFQKSLR